MNGEVAMQTMGDKAAAQAVALGHRIGRFHREEGWNAAVTTCLVCGLLAAIDLTESPYIFGRAYKRKCQ